MFFVPFITYLLIAATALADVEATLREIEIANRKRICENAYRELGVGAKRVKVEVIDVNMTDGRFHISEIPGYNPNAYYIGIANHEKNMFGKNAEGKHHWYVLPGRVRASAEPYWGAPIIKKTDLATKGILVEVPSELVKATEARALAGEVKRSPTCLHAVCALLEKDGVVIHDRDGIRKVRSKVVMANLLEGKIKIEGKDVDPETIRILATGEDELRHALVESSTADASMAGKVGVQLATKAVIFIAGGTIVTVLLKKTNSRQDQEPTYRSYEHSLDD